MHNNVSDKSMLTLPWVQQCRPMWISRNHILLISVHRITAWINSWCYRDLRNRWLYGRRDIFREIEHDLYEKRILPWNPWFSVNFNRFSENIRCWADWRYTDLQYTGCANKKQSARKKSISPEL